jgi:5-methylcytosine-specific restriction enzyme A
MKQTQPALQNIRHWLLAFVSVFLIGVAATQWTPPQPEHMPKQEGMSFSAAAPEPRSPQWPSVRAEHLKVHGECAACGQKDKLQVHHILPFHVHPEKELDPSNLITLCVDGVGHTNCHLMFGHAGNFKCHNENVAEDAKRFRDMLSGRQCSVE